MQVSMEIKNKEFLDYLKKLKDRTGTLKPYFVAAASTMDISVMKNFRAQGRPNRWTALHPLTIASRRVEGTLRGNVILQRYGILRQSIGTEIREITDNELRYGTKQIKAALLHYGGTVRPKKGKFLTIPFPGVIGRAHDYKNSFVRKGGRVIYESLDGGKLRGLFYLVSSVTIPARPYLMFQAEDIKALSEMLFSFVMDIKSYIVLSQSLE